MAKLPKNLFEVTETTNIFQAKARFAKAEKIAALFAENGVSLVEVDALGPAAFTLAGKIAGTHKPSVTTMRTVRRIMAGSVVMA